MNSWVAGTGVRTMQRRCSGQMLLVLKVLILAAAVLKPGGIEARFLMQGTKTCGDTAPNSPKTRQYPCPPGWEYNPAAANEPVAGVRDADIRLCCLETNSTTWTPTCGDTSQDNTTEVPFDCPTGLTYLPMSAKKTITGTTASYNEDALICCDKGNDATDPPDLYIELVPSSQLTTSMAATVKSRMTITIKLGVQGFQGQHSVVKDVALDGKLRGMHILSITETPNDGACTEVSHCPVRSRLWCKWGQLKPNTMGGRPKEIKLQLEATDAADKTPSRFTVASTAPGYDSNPNNNKLEITMSLKGACCMVNNGKHRCRDRTRSGCPQGSPFAPWDSCEGAADVWASVPTITATNGTRSGVNSAKGVCVVGNVCLERMTESACTGTLINGEAGRFYVGKTRCNQVLSEEQQAACDEAP